ncbi:MAG TPA: hypothetical protein VG870_05735 [Chitinophagaceae bacterium]|nr:hypothetical protein [Chitinophagaceae bacterium]
MERIEVLIRKLTDQLENKATPDQLLLTVQLLQAELVAAQAPGPKSLGTAKVAVVLPKMAAIAVPPSLEAYAPKPAAEEVVVPAQPVASPSAPPSPGRIRPASRPAESGNLLFDPLVEVPTLSQQQNPRDLNDQAAVSGSSLNDRLKQPRMELGELLKESPIKDLRKAIGINDRFLFINELFRGDEAMYERSIKTINSFHLFAEAEYWINRELVVKLGWNQDQELVRHFYLLVRRRFS